MTEQENGKRETITCPNCLTKHPLSRNPIFCIECKKRFERDSNGNLLRDEEGMAIVEEKKQTQTQNNEVKKGQPVSTQTRAQQEIKPRRPIVNEGNIYGYRSNTLEGEYENPNPKSWSPLAGIGVPLLTYLLIMAVSVVLVVLVSGINLANIRDLTSNMTFVFLTGSLSLLFLIVPLYWVQKYYPKKLSLKQRFAILGLPLKKYRGLELVREILLGIFIGVISSFLVFGLQIVSFYLVEFLYDVDLMSAIENGALSEFGIDVPGNITNLVLFVLMVFLFVGLPEEIMFRGFVQKAFESKWSKSAATWGTAVFFSLFHIFVYILEPAIFMFLFIPYLGISLLLGLLRNWRDDLYAAVVVHIVYDIVEIVILFAILN